MRLDGIVRHCLRISDDNKVTIWAQRKLSSRQVAKFSLPEKISLGEKQKTIDSDIGISDLVKKMLSKARYTSFFKGVFSRIFGKPSPSEILNEALINEKLIEKVTKTTDAFGFKTNYAFVQLGQSKINKITNLKKEIFKVLKKVHDDHSISGQAVTNFAKKLEQTSFFTWFFGDLDNMRFCNSHFGQTKTDLLILPSFIEAICGIEQIPVFRPYRGDEFYMLIDHISKLCEIKDKLVSVKSTEDLELLTSSIQENYELPQNLMKRILHIAQNLHSYLNNSEYSSILDRFFENYSFDENDVSNLKQEIVDYLKTNPPTCSIGYVKFYLPNNISQLEKLWIQMEEAVHRATKMAKDNSLFAENGFTHSDIHMKEKNRIVTVKARIKQTQSGLKPSFITGLKVLDQSTGKTKTFYLNPQIIDGKQPKYTNQSSSNNSVPRNVSGYGHSNKTFSINPQIVNDKQSEYTNQLPNNNFVPLDLSEVGENNKNIQDAESKPV
ncbi:MAG: hypothetical protein QNJ31_06635 [Candidatus Caenarcaniphilales bacterium]|nr:hypothetical protein [Candidatus Caenarcaniphilales bacterium]